MNAVLYIEIVEEWVYTYHKPILHFVQQYFPETVVFDFDNHSEAVTAGYALEIAEKAPKVVIVLRLKEGHTGMLLPFIEKMIRIKEKCLILVNGSNQVIDRMLQIFDEWQIRRNLSEELQQEEISKYLSAL